MYPIPAEDLAVRSDGNWTGLEHLSLEELYQAAEAGSLRLFHDGELTLLGHYYYRDRCERPFTD